MKLVVYWSRLTAGIIGLLWLTLVLVAVSATLIERSRYWMRGDEPVSLALRMAGWSAVEFAYQLLPVAAFLGALVAVTIIANRGEWVAAQIGGMGLGRMLATFCLTVLLFGAVDFALGEWVFPRAVAAMENIQRHELGRVDALRRYFGRRSQWFRQDPWVLYLPKQGAEPHSYASPTLYRFADGALTEILHANTLTWSEEGWLARDVVKRDMAQAVSERIASLPVALHIAPQNLHDVTGDPRRLNLQQMAAFIERRQRAGFDTAAHRLEWHQRWAFPLTAIWLFLVAVPWLLQPQKRSIPAVIGWGVVTVALYVAVLQMLRAATMQHAIHPGVGAWGGGIVCLLAAAGYGLASWLMRLRTSAQRFA